MSLRLYPPTDQRKKVKQSFSFRGWNKSNSSNSEKYETYHSSSSNGFVDKFSARPTVVAQYVQRMLDNGDLNIAWIPDVIEAKLYQQIVELAINICFNALLPLHGLTISNHHIEMEVVWGDGIPILPNDAINTQNLNLITENMMLNSKLQEIWLPTAFKRDLFFHILYIFLSILQVFVGSTQCDIIGHTLAASIQTHPLEKKKISCPSQINYHDLETFLEANHMEPHGAVDLEKSLFKIVYVMVLVIIEEVFVDFRLNLIGDAVRFNLEPGKTPLDIGEDTMEATKSAKTMDNPMPSSSSKATTTSTKTNTSGRSSQSSATQKHPCPVCGAEFDDPMLIFAHYEASHPTVNITSSAKKETTTHAKVGTNDMSNGKPSLQMQKLLAERENLQARLMLVCEQIGNCEDELSLRRPEGDLMRHGSFRRELLIREEEMTTKISSSPGAGKNSPYIDINNLQQSFYS